MEKIADRCVPNPESGCIFSKPTVTNLCLCTCFWFMILVLSMFSWNSFRCLTEWAADPEWMPERSGRVSSPRPAKDSDNGPSILRSPWRSTIDSLQVSIINQGCTAVKAALLALWTFGFGWFMLKISSLRSINQSFQLETALCQSTKKAAISKNVENEIQ